MLDINTSDLMGSSNGDWDRKKKRTLLSLILWSFNCKPILGIYHYKYGQSFPGLNLSKRANMYIYMEE